jgi:hypothetical protein
MSGTQSKVLFPPGASRLGSSPFTKKALRGGYLTWIATRWTWLSFTPGTYPRTFPAGKV